MTLEQRILQFDPTHERHIDIAGSHAEEATGWLRIGTMDCFMGTPSEIPEEATP